MSFPAPLLEQILAQNERFAQSKGTDAQSAQREAVLNEISEGIARFDELHGHLTEGAQFYRDLLTRSEQLVQTCQVRHPPVRRVRCAHVFA